MSADPHVTRSSEATSPFEVRDVERRRGSLPVGLWGMALLIATEATLFGTLLATYYYLRFQTTDWPPGSIEAPSVALPLAITGALVLTTIPMLLAAAAARAGRVGITRWMLVLAILVQAGYLAVQIILFKEDLGRFSPRDSAYGSIYFLLLGADHAHVLIGILLNCALLGWLMRGLTSYRLVGVRAVALYWYFVNAVTVLVVLTQLSPSL
jgi:heme/copper-type cytochrome/quinol oxidase subunit 3